MVCVRAHAVTCLHAPHIANPAAFAYHRPCASTCNVISECARRGPHYELSWRQCVQFSLRHVCKNREATSNLPRAVRIGTQCMCHGPRLSLGRSLRGLRGQLSSQTPSPWTGHLTSV